MNTKSILTIFSLLILLATTGTVRAESFEEARFDFDREHSHKLFSGDFLVSLDRHVRKHGTSGSRVVYFFLSDKPDEQLIRRLTESGVYLDIERYTPPTGIHRFGIVCGRIPIDSINSVLAIPEIKKIGNAESLHFPQNNEAGEISGADRINSYGFEGKDITIGICDSGLDPSWSGSELPGGTVAVDYSEYPDAIDYNIESTITGHGTNVAGVALCRGFSSADNTANGGGPYDGSAPSANLAFFKIGKDDSKSASDAAIRAAAIDAVEKYGVDILNISYGQYGVYRDGTSAVEATLDYLAETYDVPIFVSAGNSGEDKRHKSDAIAPGDTSEYFKVLAYQGSATLDFNLVCPNTDTNDAELLYYDYNHELFNTVYRYPKTVSNRGTLSAISEASSGLISGSGVFYLRVVNHGDQTLNAHIYKYSSGGQVEFDEPSYSHLTLKPGNADKAISVGAYISRNGWIHAQGGSVNYPDFTIGDVAGFSAPGPRIDNVVKPDILAPGAYIITLRDRLVDTSPNSAWVRATSQLSSKPDYYVVSGTSFAAPHAAGIAATTMERFGSPGIDDFIAAIRASAVSDQYTDITPNSKSGYGKLTADIFHQYQGFTPYLQAFPLEEHRYCMGDSIFIAFEKRGKFSGQTRYYAELSGGNGSFGSSYKLYGELNSEEDTLKCKLPDVLLESDEYKIRIMSESPYVRGSTVPENLIVQALPNVNLIGPTEVCAGQAYIYSVSRDASSVFDLTVENGEITERTDFSFTVLWDKNASTGSLTLSGRKTLSDCSAEKIYETVIFEKPDIFLEGDSVICSGGTYYFSTHVDIDEDSDWKVTGGQIKRKTIESIEVEFDNYSDATVELTISDENCESKIERIIYNLAGESSEIFGERKPIKQLIYPYTVDTIYTVETFWEVKGGEIVDSAKNYIAVRWLETEETYITVRRVYRDCDVELTREIDVRDIHYFEIEGKDSVCSEAIEQYRVSPFDSAATHEIIVSGGEILFSEGDSAVTVAWNKSGSGYVRVKKTISEVGYEETIVKNVIIREKHGASISKIDGRDAFCSGEPPYVLVEGKPEGGLYYGEAVKDGKFYPAVVGDKRSTEIFYVWKPGIECPDTVSIQVDINPTPDKPKLQKVDDDLLAHSNAILFNWYFNDTTLIETGNGKHTPALTGYYSASAISSSGCESEKSGSVYVVVESSVHSSSESPLVVYPNPAGKQITVNFKSGGVYLLTVSDVAGKVLLRQENCRGITTINTEDFARGIYFLKIRIGTTEYFEKIILE